MSLTKFELLYVIFGQNYKSQNGMISKLQWQDCKNNCGQSCIILLLYTFEVTKNKRQNSKEMETNYKLKMGHLIFFFFFFFYWNNRKGHLKHE